MLLVFIQKYLLILGCTLAASLKKLSSLVNWTIFSKVIQIPLKNWTTGIKTRFKYTEISRFKINTYLGLIRLCSKLKWLHSLLPEICWFQRFSKGVQALSPLRVVWVENTQCCKVRFDCMLWKLIQVVQIKEVLSF